MTSNARIKSSRTEVCFFPPPLEGQKVISDSRWRSGNTYVYHESTRANPSLSILSMRYYRRTTLLSHYVVLSERSFDSSTGQGGRASTEHPFAAGHLQDPVGLSNESWEENNERFILFVSCNSWWRATTNPNQHGGYLFRATRTQILSDTIC